ncbi:cytochrome c, partial [Arcobacteraceae bacterium]|nr:cytochrome c [Arcobacteraceae bacterium]
IMSEIRIEKKKEEEKIKIATKIKEEEKGKTFYLNKCASCHGLNGELKVGNATSLRELSLEKFQDAIRGYKIGSYNLGDGSEMRPYSMGVSSSDVKAIHKYFQQVK